MPEKFRTDVKYRTGHVRIINALPGRRILGVHTPEMRALAKELSRREDALDMIAGFERAAMLEDGLDHDGRKVSDGSGRGCEGGLCYEETVVWGMMINFVKVPFEDRLDLVRAFVPHIDNWAVCDMFCSGAKWFARAMNRKGNHLQANASGVSDLSCATPKEALWNFLCGYFASDREFEVRFATIMSMCYFIDEEYLPRIFFRFDELDFSRIRSEYVSARSVRNSPQPENGPGPGMGVALGEPPYYVRMAVAWLLATALVKFPDETRGYLRHSRLPDDVLKLYVRKARESFRTRDVSPF